MTTLDATDERAPDNRAADRALDTADWRGTAEPDVEDTTVTGTLRLQQQSRQLVRTLLRPHKGALWLTTLLIVVAQGTGIIGPLFIAYALDTALPALTDHRSGPLALAVGGYLASGLVSAGLPTPPARDDVTSPVTSADPRPAPCQSSSAVGLRGFRAAGHRRALPTSRS